MALVIHHPKRVFGGAAVLIAALFGALGFWAYPHLDWFYYSVPMKQFKAVCRVHKSDYVDDLRYLNGQLTEEFIVEAYKIQKNEIGFWPNTNFSDGKILKTLSFFEPISKPHTKYMGQEEEKSYYLTRGPAYRIFERRNLAGQFEKVDMSEYTIMRWSEDGSGRVPQRMKYDECGFLEDLILVGGRFAKPNPDPMP